MYIHFRNEDSNLDQIPITEFKLENGVNVRINEGNLTAGIILSTNTEEILLIPKIFDNGSKQYLIKYIDSRAFYLNKNIKSIAFSEDSELYKIDDGAFSESTIEKLSIPANVVELGKKWCSLSERLNQIVINPKNKHFAMISEKFMVGKSRLNGMFDVILFVCRNIRGIINIPKDILIIAPYAFNYCKKIRMITFNESSILKTIDDWAFYGCINIERIMRIPSSVVKVGYQSFMFVSKLKSIEFLSDEIHICDSCFSQCFSLLVVSFPNAHKITIDNSAFYGSKKGSILFVTSEAKLYGNVWKFKKKRQFDRK